MNECLVIDVSKKTESEVCNILGIEYKPWYRSSLFYALMFPFGMNAVILMLF